MIIPIGESQISNFIAYFSDESRKRGFAQSISFPTGEEEVKEILARLRAGEIPLTVQGARTGLSGAAVPQGGHILSCVKLNHIGPLRRSETGDFFLPVGAGVTMAEIEERLARETPKLFWPGAPTEAGGTVGGVLGGGSRGIYAVRCGEAADWAVNVQKVDGVILSAELKLLPIPASVWGIGFYFPDYEAAQRFILEAAHLEKSIAAALEFFNETALTCIAALRKTAAGMSALPDTSGQAAMVYVELHAQSEADSEDSAAALMALAEGFESDPEGSWAVSGASEVGRVRPICHAAQESALWAHDARLGGEAPGLDLALSDKSGVEMLNACLAEFVDENIEISVFGSLTGGRLRLCPLPRSEAERALAQKLLEDWKGPFAP